jgi:hypothetical protein
MSQRTSSRWAIFSLLSDLARIFLTDLSFSSNSGGRAMIAIARAEHEDRAQPNSGARSPHWPFAGVVPTGIGTCIGLNAMNDQTEVWPHFAIKHRQRLPVAALRARR